MSTVKEKPQPIENRKRSSARSGELNPEEEFFDMSEILQDAIHKIERNEKRKEYFSFLLMKLKSLFKFKH